MASASSEVNGTESVHGGVSCCWYPVQARFFWHGQGFFTIKMALSSAIPFLTSQFDNWLIVSYSSTLVPMLRSVTAFSFRVSVFKSCMGIWRLGGGIATKVLTCLDKASSKTANCTSKLYKGTVSKLALTFVELKIPFGCESLCCCLLEESHLFASNGGHGMDRGMVTLLEMMAWWLKPYPVENIICIPCTMAGPFSGWRALPENPLQEMSIPSRRSRWLQNQTNLLKMRISSL